MVSPPMIFKYTANSSLFPEKTYWRVGKGPNSVMARHVSPDNEGMGVSRQVERMNRHDNDAHKSGKSDWCLEI
jgi:hypothetical protein